MKEAGARAGIVIFPGCEITTGSGADGVHVLVIADPSKSGRDIDLLLASNLGFDGTRQRFLTDSGGASRPNVSSRTVEQILDYLPEGYLVIAPHAFNDNGIAAQGTVKGTVRWLALHNPQLAAIDRGIVAPLQVIRFRIDSAAENLRTSRVCREVRNNI